MRIKLITAAIFFILLAVTAYAVSLEYTTTLLYFNVNTNRDVQVFTFGGSWISATSSGAPTSGNIEFTTINPDAYWVNASIYGGSAQDGTNPIIRVQNIGTVPAQVNITINETVPSCMILRYSNDTITYPPTLTLSTTNVTLDDSLGPGDTPLDLWLFTNFSGCTVGISQRNFTVYADYTS
jgi:hypothetical protein